MTAAGVSGLRLLPFPLEPHAPASPSYKDQGGHFERFVVFLPFHSTAFSQVVCTSLLSILRISIPRSSALSQNTATSHFLHSSFPPNSSSLKVLPFCYHLPTGSLVPGLFVGGWGLGMRLAYGPRG